VTFVIDSSMVAFVKFRIYELVREANIRLGALVDTTSDPRWTKMYT